MKLHYFPLFAIHSGLPNSILFCNGMVFFSLSIIKPFNWFLEIYSQFVLIYLLYQKGLITSKHQPVPFCFSKDFPRGE